MTTREKLERKLERRNEWAEKAQARSEAEFAAAHSITEHIPLGQPILVGHHSEAGHRRDISRMESHMDKGCAEYRKAEYHESKARGLEAQLNRTIFSDDEDAVERLEAKIAEKEALQSKYRNGNKIIRGKLTADEKVAELVKLGFGENNARERVERNLPIPSYAMTNNNGEIRRLKQRVAEIKARNERKAKAEESTNGVTLETYITGMCRVTFAEKPDRSILRALGAAGFWWRSGSWHGQYEKIPECVLNLIDESEVSE